jgi:nitrogenase molybdenum-iron protein beta chain
VTETTSIPLRVLDYSELFDTPEYQRQFAGKREFEAACDPEEVARVVEWTRSPEYREKNFARESLVINPMKSCQPLGAVLAARGFAKTLPLVHGSQGCVAYFRSHLTRHFKEPTPAVSSSMTEDGAVFGGLTNLIEALENAYALYRPDLIAVSTTCMAEVIGDDLANFITTAKAKEAIPEDYPVPFAHTPSFVGSHLQGYDAMLRGILGYLTGPATNSTTSADPSATTGGAPADNGKINIVPGFVTNVGDLREIKRILRVLGVAHTVLGDCADAFDSPATGGLEYPMFPGGTPLADAAAAASARATLFLQENSTRKTADLVSNNWGHPTATIEYPVGVANTDRFVTEAARLAGVSVPDQLTVERGRLIDAMADSYAYLHGKRVALVGDPDLVTSMLGFLLELGMMPVHVIASNGDAGFAARAGAVCAASPFGAQAKIWPGKDLWHLRSLVFTEPVDLIIGPSHLKYLAREAGVPLVRFGFPIFDRHHLHRFAVAGYSGGVWLLSQLVNTILDEMDRTASDRDFDLVR